MGSFPAYGGHALGLFHNFETISRPTIGFLKDPLGMLPARTDLQS